MNYQNLTLDELIQAAQLDAVTPLEIAFLKKLTDMQTNKELLSVHDALEMADRMADYECNNIHLMDREKLLCKQVALMRLAIDSIDKRNHKAHLDDEAKHWELLPDDLVELIECMDLSDLVVEPNGD